MSTHRGKALALLVTAVGAVLVLATAAQPRWTVAGATVSGGGAPAASALALVALAGVGLLFLLRGWARSVLGLLLLAAGIAVVLVDVSVGASAAGWFDYAPLGADRPRTMQRSSWFWLTAGGGALVAVGGALVAGYGRRWPSARRDYAAPAGTDVPRRDPWTALDRGEDPTL